MTRTCTCATCRRSPPRSPPAAGTSCAGWQASRVVARRGVRARQVFARADQRRMATRAQPRAAGFVAVKNGNILWYGELILCFAPLPPRHRQGQRRAALPGALAAADRRRRTGRAARATAAEALCPFEVYRWATHTGSFMTGHPRHSTPQYGVVDAGQVRYRSPIFVGPSEMRGEQNPLFRLVADMFGRF